MRTVAAQNDQAVQLSLLVGFEHTIQLGYAVLIRNLHHFKRLTGGSQNRAADGQNTGKITRAHDLCLILNQTAVTIEKTDNFNVGAKFLIQCLCNTADGRVQTLAIAAAGQHTDSFHN